MAAPASRMFPAAPLARPPAPIMPTLISSETCAQAKLVPSAAKVAAAPMAAVEPFNTLRRVTPAVVGLGWLSDFLVSFCDRMTCDPFLRRRGDMTGSRNARTRFASAEKRAQGARD